LRLDNAGLHKISLGTSAIGLILLFLVSEATQVDTVKISEIDYDMAGSLVSVTGNIVSKRIHDDGHIFLKIEDDTGKISAVIFSSDAKKLDPVLLSCLETGKTVSVTGMVEEYQGSLEMIPKTGDGLRCLSS